MVEDEADREESIVALFVVNVDFDWLIWFHFRLVEYFPVSQLADLVVAVQGAGPVRML